MRAESENMAAKTKPKQTKKKKGRELKVHVTKGAKVLQDHKPKY
jgi:hypothetical protein